MSDIASRVAARYQGLPLPTAQRKTAGMNPFPPKEGETQELARNIPKNHDFNKKALKPLALSLWASTVALGHALTAHRHLSRLKSTTVSPDGRLGGQGYVMNLGGMRQKLWEASEALSAISDTLYDEISAPHWKPKLAQLDESDQQDVSRFVEEAEEVMDNPAGEAEEGIQEIESKPKKKKEEDTVSSGLPSSGDSQAEPESRATLKQASDLHTELPLSKLDLPSFLPKGATSAQDLWKVMFSSVHQVGAAIDLRTELPLSKLDLTKRANSSLPVSELEGGPRVDHLGPGTGNGQYGDFTDEEQSLPDEWSADGGGLSRRDDHGEDYDYPSEWENEMPMTAESLYPDANSDPTPTDAWDFGLGFGAKGQGAGGYANPSGEGDGSKGVIGPQSGLPGTPAQSPGDTTTVVLDNKLNPRHAAKETLVEALYGVSQTPDPGPVSRSDYFPGKKDNMVSVGQSELPEQERVEGIGGQALVDTYYNTEDMNSDYERYDYTTKTLREPSGNLPGQSHQEPWAPDGESTR